jgi:ligand-binding sensor domain-containing protein
VQLQQMKLIVLLILLWGFGLMANAQNFHYKYYSERDGLSNAAVNNIVTDNDGFLWVATAAGLNRFDGNAFEKFYNNPTDKLSIADNYIQKLFVDAKKRLWIGTNAGISLYHPGSNNFSNYAPDTTVLRQQGISFGAICDDNKNNIWVGTKNDLLIFDPQSEKFVSSGWSAYAAAVAPVNSNHQRVIVTGLLKKNNEELWVLSTYGLFSVNTSAKKFAYYKYEALSDFFSVHLDHAEPGGNVWMSSYGNGLLCFDSRNNTWTNYFKPPSFSNSVFTYGITPYVGDTLIFASGSSIVFFDKQQKQMLFPLKDEDSANTKFKTTEGRSVLFYQGHFWLGTNMGLVKITPFKNPFQFFALTSQQQIDWVSIIPGTNTFLFNAIADNYTTYIKKAGSNIEAVLGAGNKNIHVKYPYFALGKDGVGYLNGEEHFYKFNSVTNKTILVPFQLSDSFKAAVSVRNMVIDREGTVWVRTVNFGIFKYDPIQNILVSEKDLPHKPEIEINTMYYDSLTHSIWYSEEFNGVNVYDIVTKKITHYGLGKNPSQRNAAVIYMSGDGKGNVWLSDLQAGLIAYNYTNKNFTRLTASDGLLSDNCWSTVCDKAGILWINTDKGLCKYDTKTKKFVGYKDEDGFPVSPEVFLSLDIAGNVYMPYKNGYYTWNSNEITDPKKKGTIYLKDVQLFDAHLPTDTSFSFSYKQNNIRLLFGLLSFDSRDAVAFEYSLNGSSWVPTDDHSYISFANLAPGKYNLTIRIKNEDIPAKHFNFTIAKPFWLQWWFLLLLVAIIAAAIFFIGRKRFQQMNDKSLLQQKVMESEMSALRSQMNPHFIFNTLNSINSYIIENKKDEASDYLTDFSRLMRTILEHSQKRTVTLSDELNALKLYLELESKRLEAAFDYSISISDGVDISAVSIPPLIIQPFAENAIWHGLRGKRSGGHLEIIVKKYEDGTRVIVQDDGIGRQAAEKNEKVKESNSFGTAATMQRILLTHPRSTVQIEDLYHSNGNAAGTRVNIYLYHNFN